jgi:hypothetical protein
VDSCTSSVQYVNFSQPLTAKENATWGGGIGYLPKSRVIFEVGFGIVPGQSEKLLFETVIATGFGNST